MKLAFGWSPLRIKASQSTSSAGRPRIHLCSQERCCMRDQCSFCCQRGQEQPETMTKKYKQWLSFLPFRTASEWEKRAKMAGELLLPQNSVFEGKFHPILNSVCKNVIRKQGSQIYTPCFFQDRAVYLFINGSQFAASTDQQAFTEWVSEIICVFSVPTTFFSLYLSKMAPFFICPGMDCATHWSVS